MLGQNVWSRAGVVWRHAVEDFASWLAFAGLLSWMFGLYWSDLSSFSSASDPFGLLEARSLWLASEAVTLLVVSLALRSLFLRVLPFAFGFGTCLLAGTLAVVFVPADSSFGFARLVGVVLTGVGSALLLSFAGVVLARKGPKALLIDVAIALFAASALDAVSVLLPRAPRSILVAFLPIVCVLLAVSAGRHALASEDFRSSLATGRSHGLNTARVVALPLVVGLSFGLMQRLAGGGHDVGGQADAATILSFALSAAFIALATQMLESRGLVKLVCFAAIPVMGVAFVALPLLSDAWEAIQALCIVGFNSFYFMVWALWSDEAGVSPRHFVVGLFALVGAEGLGITVGAPVVAATSGSESAVAVVSLVAVYFLLMSAIFLLDRSSKVQRTAPFASTPSPVTGDEDADVGRLCAGLAERCGLSAREAEVLELLARGRNRAYISQTLFISDNTTRTHMKNIYRKLGVHSQQELIDRVMEGEPKEEGVDA